MSATCQWKHAWATGTCGKPVVGETEFCEKHHGELCWGCKVNQATRECSTAYQFVCGAPLCEYCHDCGSPGGHGKKQNWKLSPVKPVKVPPADQPELDFNAPDEEEIPPPAPNAQDHTVEFEKLKEKSLQEIARCMIEWEKTHDQVFLDFAITFGQMVGLIDKILKK